MKKIKYIFAIILFVVLSWVGYQTYWYLRNDGNVTISVSNGTFSLEDVKTDIAIKLYINDKLVSEDKYQNIWSSGGMHTFVFKLNFGCHKITVKAQTDSGSYEEEIHVFIGLAFVRWIDFELIDVLSYYNEKGEPVEMQLPKTPFDTIQAHDIRVTYKYEFITRVSLSPLVFY